MSELHLIQNRYRWYQSTKFCQEQSLGDKHRQAYSLPTIYLVLFTNDIEWNVLIENVR